MIFKSLAFWKGVSFLVAGFLIIGNLFGVVPAQYVLDAGAILAIALSILAFFGIHPEIRQGVIPYMSRKFWEAISFLIAGLLLLGNIFGLVPDSLTLGAGAILTGILAVLNFFNVYPELRSRRLMK